MPGDPILWERYNERTEDERQSLSFKEPVKKAENLASEVPKKPAIKLFFDMKHAVEGRGELEEKFRDVKKAALRYAQTVAAFKRSRINLDSENFGTRERNEKEERANSDLSRRVAHNALIDSVNILSRGCAEAGVDNLWRRGLGLTREALGAWALEAADFISKDL